MARIDDVDLRPAKSCAVDVVRIVTEFVSQRRFPEKNWHCGSGKLIGDRPRTERRGNDDQILAGGLRNIGVRTGNHGHGKPQGPQPIEHCLIAGPCGGYDRGVRHVKSGRPLREGRETQERQQK